MRQLTILVLFASLSFAEMPHFSGVWKADLQQSKFSGGPPPASYMVIIEQKTDVVDRRTKETAPEFVETTGTKSERGERRSVLTAFDYAKPVVRPFDGIPTRLIGVANGNTFTVTGEVYGTPDHFKRTYTLSPDGQSLTVAITGKAGDHPLDTTVLLTKVPDADGAQLRAPEELASARFKNVKEDALKNLPASEFINTMHYFSWSLGKECTFCHVEHKFDADDKKEKQTARKMVEMVSAIDEHNFEGHPAVRCFTCHEAHAHPLSHPLFPDEIAAEQKDHDQPPPAATH